MADSNKKTDDRTARSIIRDYINKYKRFILVFPILSVLIFSLIYFVLGRRDIITARIDTSITETAYTAYCNGLADSLVSRLEDPAYGRPWISLRTNVENLSLSTDAALVRMRYDLLWHSDVDQKAFTAWYADVQPALRLVFLRQLIMSAWPEKAADPAVGQAESLVLKALLQESERHQQRKLRAEQVLLEIEKLVSAGKTAPAEFRATIETASQDADSYLKAHLWASISLIFIEHTSLIFSPPVFQVDSISPLNVLILSLLLSFWFCVTFVLIAKFLSKLKKLSG